MYNMTRDGFTLVAMGFIGKEAITWKEKYIAAFNAMEAELLRQSSPDWLAVRSQGKVMRREETDVIQQFILYATEQGSKNAEKYYVNITRMENRALFLLEDGLPKPDNLREVLDTFQLVQLATADRLVADTLRKGMDEDMPYKEIFQWAKSEVMKLAELIGQSPIPIPTEAQQSLTFH